MFLTPISKFLGCADGWTIFDHTGRCYRFFSDGGGNTFEENLRACEAEPFFNSILASIPDIQTNDFLKELSEGNDNGGAWIGGLQDNNEVWMWSDGSLWTGFANWGPDQPDNQDKIEDFLNFNFPGPGEWNDRSNCCLSSRICQYDP